jgi:Flp pilus assembly pilin Flp
MNKNSGQAVVEYILVFAFVSMIAIGMVRGLGKALTTSVGSLGYYLTNELNTGACVSYCALNNHHNNVE